MDSFEDCARPLGKRKKEDLETLSEWAKSVRSLIQNRIKIPNGPMSTQQNIDL